MVSIWKQAQLGFNSAAINEYKLREHKFAVLFYDEDAKTVGIMLTNDKNEGGALKIISRGHGSLSVSAKSFLNFYKIDYSETRSFPSYLDKENNLIVFKLDE